MLKNVTDPKDIRDMLLSILSTSGTLAGISLALVGISNLKASNAKIETLSDDMFLLSSMGFVIVCYFTFFALKRISSARIQQWTNAIDIIFLGSLTLLTIGGFMTVYTFI